MASENYQHMQGSPPALSRLEQLIYEEPLHQMRLQELANQQANTVQELTQQNVQEVQGLTNQLNHTKAQCNRYAACMQEFIEKADRLEQEKDALKSQISQQRKEHNALLDSTRRDADAKLRDAQSLIKQHEDRAKVLQAQLDSMIGHIGMMDRFTRQQDSTLATSNKGVGSKRTRGAAEMHEPVSEPSKRLRMETIIPCTQCYTRGWTCDNDPICENCKLRGKTGSCKRVMCKNYTTGTCKTPQCTFAHEGDDFPHVTQHIKLRQTASGPSPKEKKEKKDKRT